MQVPSDDNLVTCDDGPGHEAWNHRS
jgi:hypothetical protein